MNAFGRARGRISAAGLDDHADLAQGVLLIVGVVGEDFELPAVELLGPVALLASFLRRAQIVHRSRNRPRVGIEHGGKNLPAAGKFGLHKPGCARSHVALCAGHPGMRRKLIRRVFRTHHGVAQLATKSHRLGKLVGFVAARDADHDEHHQERHERNHRAALRRIIEIDARIEGGRRHVLPPLHQHAGQHQQQPRTRNAGDTMYARIPM